VNTGFHANLQVRPLSFGTMADTRPVSSDYADRMRPLTGGHSDVRGVSGASEFFRGLYARAEEVVVPSTVDEDPAVDALEHLLLLDEGWDGRAAPAPNIGAVNVARSLLQAGRVMGLATPRVVADVEGGVATYFFGGVSMEDGGWSRSGGLLTFNDGGGAIYLRDRLTRSTDIEEVSTTDTNLGAVVRRIQSFLLGQ